MKYLMKDNDYQSKSIRFDEINLMITSFHSNLEIIE